MQKYTREWIAQADSSETNQLDGNTQAGRPGHIPLDFELALATDPTALRHMPRAKLFDLAGEHLAFGLADPALVVATDPLLVSVYSGEFDWVVQLEFPKGYMPPVPLRAGQRVLAVNTFGRRKPPPDIVFGPLAHANWVDMTPYIADLMTRDTDALAATMARIEPEEWVLAEHRTGIWHMTFGPRTARAAALVYNVVVQMGDLERARAQQLLASSRRELLRRLAPVMKAPSLELAPTL